MKKWNTWKWLGMLFCSVFLTTGMAVPVFAATYNLWVGGTQVTDDNKNDVLHDGTVSFTPSDGTLTLNGANITTGYAFTSYSTAGIYYEDSEPLTIELESGTENTIKSVTVGIRSKKDLIISGNGIFKINGSKVAIDCDGNVNFGNGTVTANGSVLGVRGTSVTINDGSKVTAVGYQAIDGIVKNSIAGIGWMNMDGTGSEATIDVNTDPGRELPYSKVQFLGADLYPLWVGGVQVTSKKMHGPNWYFYPNKNTLMLHGKIEGSGEFNDGGITYDCGIYSDIPDLTIEVITDSKVQGSGTKTYSYGIRAVGHKLTITGDSELEVIGGSGTNGEGAYGYTYGICADSITLEGKLKAMGGLSRRDSASYGVETGEIKGNGELTAAGYDAGINSIARGITFDGVTVTAQGGKYGIRSGVSTQNNNTVTIKKGSSVIASGTEAGIYGNVKNEVAGAGWTDTAGTEGKARIDVSTEGRSLTDYRKVQFPVFETYPLWVGSVQVTEGNQTDVLGDGTVSFTPASGSTPATLTLNGANISGDNDNCTYDKASYAYGTIRTGLSDLTVNVTADSTVTGPGGKSEYSYGILGRETNLTVSGKGTLNVSGGSNGGYNGGIHSATITINGKVSAAGGEPDGSKYPSSTGEGLYPIKSITINEGAELTATAASSGGMAIYSRNKTLKNAVTGIGWKTLQDTETQTIQISTAGQPVPEFMKVRFPGTAGTFTVTFDANGGSGTMKDVKDVSGAYELPESLFNAPEDKTFDCWLVEGKEYAAGDTITVTSDVTVKAQWKDMPAHVHKLTLKEEKKATCTKDGLKAHYICDICDRWFEDATGLVEIRNKSSYVIDALGHEWGAWKQTKAPTAAEEGEETRTCSRCGEKETRSISRSGDDKKDDANTDDRKDEGRKSGGKDRSSGSRSSSASSSIGGHAQGQWRLAADGWHFDLLGGSQATGWQNILYNGRYGWYYFDENGLMQTGWINDNGSRYYLNPVSDGWMGEMFTGWHQIDGKWYYFETMPGHNQGHMYVNMITPDGYYCGADGAWDGMPAGSGR